MNCIRCGREYKIEIHHKAHRINGGGEEPENKQARCRDCHKYQHTKERIIDNAIRYLNWLRYGPEFGQRVVEGRELKNLHIQLHRLAVLEQENTVQQIVARGYTSYWTDPTTHAGAGFKFK